MQEKFCLYYRARVEKRLCWFVSSAVRGTEHVAFDRAYDVAESIFEFFVPAAMEPMFLQVMEYLEKRAAVTELTKIDNRFWVEEVCANQDSISLL